MAFFVQRQRSSFLAIERDAAAAVEVAAAHGLSVADAFALRDLVGVAAAAATWQGAAAEFARLRGRLGDGLAAVAVAGAREAAVAARDGAADAAAAWAAFRTDPRAAPGLRFLHLRERFAQRIDARD